jgi:hypothetical protein
LEEKDKTELFLRYYDELVDTHDDDELHKKFAASLVNTALKKYIAESKDKIIYYAPCRLVQLFEYFYGFLVIKATKVVEFVPIVNKTKDVNLKILIREVKYVNNHRYMFKPVGKLVSQQASKYSFITPTKASFLSSTMKTPETRSRKLSPPMLPRYWRCTWT